ncbi:hypothetical protein EPIB1_1235 [Tritonibacter mobilis]|nr:hypothetical protein EPIB1_1235 [Tritonibacter mobilis]
MLIQYSADLRSRSRAAGSAPLAPRSRSVARAIAALHRKGSAYPFTRNPLYLGPTFAVVASVPGARAATPHVSAFGL